MGTEIVINAEPYQTRVAILENGMLAELYMESPEERGIVGNIYKGRVLKVLPGMQAAFVDLGLEKAGFLYVADVTSPESLDEYEKFMNDPPASDLPLVEPAEMEYAFPPPRDRKSSARLPIEEILQEGQEILVQVSKEPIGGKGCRITSNIALPGRYLVFTPTGDHVGVSRRIEEETERRRLRDLVKGLKSPGSGFIIRTVSAGKSEAELQSDINFLTKLWADVLEKGERMNAPALIHNDLDLTTRIIRDQFTDQVDRLVIDSPTEFERVRDFLHRLLPHLESKLVLYEEREPIFDAFGIELEISKALGPKVWLKSGGYIVIEETEALVAVDINTGRFVGKHNLEETILKTNLEAVKEIVYQIRLRNIGGIIIIDFIDMESEPHKERVFTALEQALKADRNRTTVLRLSELGLVQMTRKRVRENLTNHMCQPCHYCEGKGVIKSTRTICYEIFRELQRAANSSPRKKKLVVTAHPTVANLLLDEKESFLNRLEGTMQKRILVKVDYSFHLEHYEVVPL